MKYGWLLVTFCFGLFGCTQSQNHSIENSLKNEKGIMDKATNGATTSPIPQNLSQKIISPGSDTLIANLQMDKNNRRLEIPVFIDSARILFVQLNSADSTANIRISQIGMPDGTYDGPFGRSLKYKIKMQGNYKIIIGQNLMAGNPWAGNLEMKAWVK